ncbi:oxygenase MpaB family protein [Algoriphagus namhaensis]
MDEPADQAVRDLIERPDLCELINSWQVIPRALPDDLPESVAEFFRFYRQKEEEVPIETLAAGKSFFTKRGDIYLAMLGFYSLPYCYAFADGAQVLIRSQRIISNIGERLGETGSFLMALFDPKAFSESQEAYLVCAKVRLIHAFSRLFIFRFAKDWDPAFGKPVNQEDMIGTNLAFSLLVLRGMRKIGQEASQAEIQTILAYWKWVGELMGLEVSYWPETSKEAFELEKLIRKRHLRPSQAGQKLTKALIRYYEGTIPDPVLGKQAETIVSFFVGEEASRAIGISQGLPLQGNLLGAVLRLSGFRVYGSKKSYQAIQNQFEQNQIEQFGKVLQVDLPVVKRS